MSTAATTRILGFQTKYRQKGGKTVGVDYVTICALGQADRTAIPIPMSTFDRLRAIADPVNDQAAMQMHDLWNVIRPAYEAWKQGQELPENGIQLAAWPGVTPEQAQILRGNGFRSVEELAAANDSAMTRIQLPGARALVENAQRFLAAQDKNKVAAELAAKDEQIARLRDDQAEMMKLLEEMQAQINESKPRRGRPPKVETDEHEAA
jgi:hypothetical protein